MTQELTEDERRAVDMALRPHRDLVRRYGDGAGYLGTFDAAMLGFRGFGERIAGDALRKIDYVLRPKLEGLDKGRELVVGGLSFVRTDGDGLAVAVSDGTAAPRFRIVWQDEGAEATRTDLKIQECPAHDPLYPHAPGIGFGTIQRDLQNPVENRCLGTLWGVDFYRFVDAMDVLRPALAAEIAAMPRQTPSMPGLPYSHEELFNLEIADAVRLDGGLPGRLCRRVFSEILESRAPVMLRSLAVRADELARWLEAQDCVWGGASMTTRDRDNVHFAVRSPATGSLALLTCARNGGGEFVAYLISTDEDRAVSTIHAARMGRHLFETVRAFVRGDPPDAPLATVDLGTGAHDVGRAIVETGIIDLALCHVRYLKDDVAAAAAAGGEDDEDERFERVEDFDFFVEASSWADDDDADVLEALLPAF